jgi:hypothetical protein
MGRRYPYTVTLDHDVTTYFEQIKFSPSVLSLEGKMQTLGSFPAAELTSEAEQPQLYTLAFAGSVAHIDGWELPSVLRSY